ncbi:zinc-binding dehydrogenase [Sorangium sp. So ce1182]|uniref:zinc-binding dehydrogenase n=1 Tax=Sorangium sp. So ce1182 TaxID=3133334 RepID=UPI003F5F029C
MVGIGGLGHLALQCLARWGCEVTAISSSRDKEEVARGLGATNFIATKGTDELRKAAQSFDFGCRHTTDRRGAAAPRAS